MSAVANFAKEIIDSASKGWKGRTFSENRLVILYSIVVCVATIATLPFYLVPFYHLSGFLSAFVDRVANRYSAYKVLGLFEDRRFREYGFDKFFEEATILPDRATRKDLMRRKTILMDIGFLIAAFVFPPIGYGSLAMAYPYYMTNATVAREIRAAIRLGDHVKQMLSRRVPYSEISKWLQSRSSSTLKPKEVHKEA